MGGGQLSTMKSLVQTVTAERSCPFKPGLPDRPLVVVRKSSLSRWSKDSTKKHDVYNVPSFVRQAIISEGQAGLADSSIISTTSTWL
ncbi:hypothetical protein J6590_038178 [Homalodisca vitripennis]|nr:hypothetical protein J6590_038178 [Homalodisca vitripennis]